MSTDITNRGTQTALPVGNGGHMYHDKNGTSLPQLNLQRAGCEVASPVSSPSTSSPASLDKTDNGYSAMRCEEERLKTFTNWPVPFLSPEHLAKNGFYYLGRGDEVRCAFCKVEIMRWVEGDDAAKDHKRWAPQCPFIREQNGSSSSDGEDIRGHDVCGTRAPAAAPVAFPGPVHAKYSTHAARLKTFEDWPRSMRQKPDDLAEAGFFYTGQGDKTKCFFCDGGLKDWEEDDVPWEQHARWFDKCAYVQLVKGRHYVQRVISQACVIPAPKKPEPTPALPETIDPPKEEKKPIEESKLCKICFEEELNVCFVPCGHVVACAKCALSTDKCPLCRKTFTNAVRLYFS